MILPYRRLVVEEAGQMMAEAVGVTEEVQEMRVAGLMMMEVMEVAMKVQGMMEAEEVVVTPALSHQCLIRTLASPFS